jgi:glutamate-1-semialdehyde 2,1-aminomutase
VTTAPAASGMRTKGGAELAAAVAAAEERYTRANPKSLQRHREAAAVMPGGNTRSVLHYSPFPVTFARAEGATLHDLDGHAYADLLGEYTAGLYGHSHPVIMAAAADALAGGIVLGGANRWEAELARLITARFPSCDLIRFCNSGTEANLMALVTARAVTGRAAILAFAGAYHGGVLMFANGGSPINVPFPSVIAPYNDAAATAALIDRHAQKLAAILVEPMMGSGGAIPADPAFLATLRAAASQHGIVLVFDEVMTSRLSPGGLQEKLGVRPDLTTFGKYLGGGFSFGAFGGARHLMERYDPRRPDAFAHAGTFNNNVLSMAAGVAGLEQVYTPDAAVALNARGDNLRARLNHVLAERQAGAQVTGVGSLLNVHFQRGEILAPTDVDPAPASRALFHLVMMERGFYLARRGFMALSLALTDDDGDRFVEAFDEFFATYGHLVGAGFDRDMS